MLKYIAPAALLVLMIFVTSPSADDAIQKPIQTPRQSAGRFDQLFDINIHLSE